MSLVSYCLFFLKFQFHKGTIRTVQSSGTTRIVSDFNSIKVRLELYKAGTFFHSS